MAHVRSDIARQGATVRLLGPSPVHHHASVIERSRKHAEPCTIPEIVDLTAVTGACGFRKAHPWSEVISVVRALLERSLEWSQNVLACQVNFVRVYDCVTHEAIFACMRRRGVSDIVSVAHLCDMMSSGMFV